jgi:hypothetical protein
VLFHHGTPFPRTAPNLQIITCATVTILLTYFSLCSENYHWYYPIDIPNSRWWRAFLTAGASSLYIFLHSLLYWFSKLSLGGFTSNVLYLGYSLLLTFLYFILTGTYPEILMLMYREYWLFCDLFLYEENLWKY